MTPLLFVLLVAAISARGHEVVYEPARPLLGLALMYVAGIVSGLLGIG